jgi:hypothetical protein
MKYLLAGCLTFLALFALQNTPAYADNKKLDFALVNKTGYGIKEVYIGPHSSDEWGENLINDAFENGETLNISFDSHATATRWDIKIVWVDPDSPVQWMNCKLSGISKFIMHYNRDTGETSADTE